MFTFRKILLIAVCAIFVFSSICNCVSIARSAVDSDTVDYYENLINSELEKALNYELPTSAEMYKPNDDTIEEFGTFDFIVIGAGSTGSVIASRLSEISKWKVLLLEAGKYPNNFTMIPGFFAIQAMTEYNWGFVSTPQKTACLGALGKRCVVHRGKGIGGTSLLNQLIYSRGNSIDYDRWADLLQDPSWRYENVLNHFKKSENFHKTNPNAPVDWEFHGKKGEWHTNFHMPQKEFTKIFMQANQELGMNITDYNGKEEMGATILQLNTKDGKRYDQATAFIKPYAWRKNLLISPESYVIKIEINNKTNQTTGVLFTKNNKLYRAKIINEVILSAGAISSPQILMLSGIGPTSHLSSKNITLIKNLEVGSKLRDHVFAGIHFSSNFTNENKDLKNDIKQYLKGYGDLTAGNPIDAAGWYKTKLQKIPNYPDIEVIPTLFGISEFGRKFLQFEPDTYTDLYGAQLNNSFALTLVLLQTQSAGTIRLKNNDPFTYPLIDYNSLSDAKDNDINTLHEGVELLRKLTQTSAFKRIKTRLEVRPIKACATNEFQSKSFWHCYLRQISIPAFHPVGTCPSGRDPKEGAVVDRNMRVFGINKLRVVDASVIPFTFSGHPNAVCTMIAEKIADVIKAEYKVF